MDKSVDSKTPGVPSTYPTKNVKQIFNVGKGIDQLMDDPGKRVLQRVIVDRGEVKVHWHMSNLVVIEFLQYSLLDMPEIFWYVIRIQLRPPRKVTHHSYILLTAPRLCGQTPRNSHSDSPDRR